MLTNAQMQTMIDSAVKAYTYIADNAGDIVVENAGEGVGNVQSSVSYTLSDNVEKLALMQMNKTLQPGGANDDNYEDRRTA